MTAMFRKIKRYWRVGFSYALGLNRTLAGPIAVHIETTNICNFRCVYCPQSKPEDHFATLGRGKMSLSDFKVILDKVLSAWNIHELVLTRDGEPLVHPRLHEFIAYAAQKNLDVTIAIVLPAIKRPIWERVKNQSPNKFIKNLDRFVAGKTFARIYSSSGKGSELLSPMNGELKEVNNKANDVMCALIKDHLSEGWLLWLARVLPLSDQ